MSQEEKYIYTNWRKILSAQYVYTKIWITNEVLLKVSKVHKFLSSHTTSSVFFRFLCLYFIILLCYQLHIRIWYYIFDLRWFQEEEKSHILFIVFMTYYAATILCLQQNNQFEDDSFFSSSFSLDNLQAWLQREISWLTSYLDRYLTENI